MKTNKGISLIVLVITIIVMIILAGAIIMTLSSNGIIGKANEAVEKSNIRQIESLATMLWAEAYANKAQDLKAAVEDGLAKNGITADKYAGYRLEVSANGVGFVKLNGDVTPPTDNPTASDDQPGNNNPGDNGSTTGKNIIPAGGRYGIYVDSAPFRYLEAGEEFPTTTYSGDIYEYGDYRYTYTYTWDSYVYGWSVALNDNVVDRNSSSTFGEILETINGQPIIMMTNTFENCTSLTIVPTIPSTVTNLRYTFQNCTLLTTIPQMPTGVTSMQGTFAGCTGLTTVQTLPTSVGSMEYTFQGCTSLTTVESLPNSLTSMHGTFAGCTALTTVPTIPSNVTYIPYLFQDCTSLTTVPEMPNGVTFMQGTFAGCTGLTTVQTLPTSVTSIQETFSGCTSLTTAPAIPASVTEMYGAFQNCTALTTAPAIPSNVTDLNYTFNNCTSLTTVPTLPTSVTRMYYTFSGCSALNDIQYGGTVEQWDAIEKTEWSNGSSITEVSCSNGKACPNHMGGTATCQQRAICDNCGNEYGELTSHIGGTATCQQRAICDNCGNEYGELASHISADGSCTVCGSAITTIESPHSPYENDINYIVLGTWDYSDATSVNITITYQTESNSWDWCSITSGTDYIAGSSQYDTRNYLNTNGEIVSVTGDDYNVKFGDSALTTKTFSNVNMLTGSAIFRSDSSVNEFYGVKIEVSPNY